MHVVHDGRRFARDPERWSVEWHREERAGAGIDQMSRGRVAAEAGAFDEHPTLAGLEQHHLEAGVPGARTALQGEEHGAATRQHLRPAVARLSFGGLRQLLELTRRRRHAPQTGKRGGQDDLVIGAPAGAAQARSRREAADAHRRAALDWDFEEVQTLLEPHPAAVGREERAARAVAALNGAGIDIRLTAEIKSAYALGATSHEGHLVAQEECSRHGAERAGSGAYGCQPEGLLIEGQSPQRR